MCCLVARTGKPESEPGQELKLPSPISLRRVLGYGILFLAIQVVGTLAARLFGNFGLMAASGISGIASSASTTVAVANLTASGKIAPELAGTAAVIGSMTSALTNVPVVFKRLPAQSCSGLPVLLLADSGWHRGTRSTAPFSIIPISEDADPEIPIYKQAKAEYARLQ